MNGSSLKELAADVEFAIESDYNKAYMDDAGNVTHFSVDAQIGVGQATGDQHQLYIRPDGQVGSSGRALGYAGDWQGRSFDRSREALLSDRLLTSTDPNVSFGRTASHEFGHLAGLRHPASGSMPGNLMNQTKDGPGRNVTRSQLETIVRNPRFRK